MSGRSRSSSGASWVGWWALLLILAACGSGEGLDRSWPRDDTAGDDAVDAADRDATDRDAADGVGGDVAPWVDPSLLSEPGPFQGTILDAEPLGLPGTDACPASYASCAASGYCCPTAAACVQDGGCSAPWCCAEGAGGTPCGGGYCASGTTCTANPGGAAMCGMELCCTPEPEEACPGDLAGECPSGTTCLLNHSARACTGIRFACYHPTGLIACPREVLCPSTVDFCPEGTTCTGLTDGICPAQSRGAGGYCCRPGSPAEELRGSFAGPFGSVTTNVGCGYSVSLAGQVVLSVVVAADGSISGTGTVPVTVTTDVTSAPAGTDCTGGSFETTATGDLAGADASLSGSFSDGVEPRPLTASFTGSFDGPTIHGTLTVAKVMHSTSTAGDEDFAMSAVFPDLILSRP